jgi:alpha-1,4-digalacturonate transport system permease protein
VLYLGTIMIPFVVLIIPLYQLMVLIGWVDKLAALVIPWIFTAYGTFLMRQFFIQIPKEIEEAALIDGASRLEILRRIFLPASVPALATQATFTFLYAWNSFVWPLLIINTGNEKNHVLTLSLSILRGRASDSPNLILAGAAISVLPPLIVFILAQRFYIESVTSSGVKG